MARPMPEPAPVTSAVLPSRRMRYSFSSNNRNLRHDTIRPGPAESLFGARARAVFAADPAGIAEPVQRREDFRKIDFALVRLAARRHRGDLHVADKREMRFQAPDQIAADDLGVIEIELNAQVRRTDLFDDFGGVLETSKKITRPVAGIDRLDQKRDAGWRRLRGRAFQIFQKHGFGRRPLLDRDAAGHAMDRGAADHDHIIERLAECRVPFALAARTRAETEIAVAAHRRVDAELGEAMPLQLRLHGRRRYIIRKLQLDRSKASRRGRAEALEQRALGEQITEIGGEAGHAHIAPGNQVSWQSACYFWSVPGCSGGAIASLAAKRNCSAVRIAGSPLGSVARRICSASSSNSTAALRSLINASATSVSASCRSCFAAVLRWIARASVSGPSARLASPLT